MLNNYRIEGNIVIIELRKRKGDREVQEVIIDKKYLQLALDFKGSWYAMPHQRTGRLYARGYYHDPVTKKVQQPLLHRLISTPGKGEITTHLDGNTLNCCEENMFNMPIGADIEEVKKEQALLAVLEDAPGKEDLSEKPYVCTCGQLMYTPGKDGKCETCVAEERKAEAGDVTPVKGVSFHKTKAKWEASPFFEGKRYRLGYWLPDQLQEANAAVTEFREVGPDEYFKRHPKGAKK